jgi:acid phosphatase family membrane protein YuiD
MPSAHSSFVFSLATVVGVVDGIYSTTFVIAAAAVILILDDALRLRIFLAGYGQALDRLVRRLPPPERKEYPYVETRLGHRPLEVFMGGILGILISLAILWMTAAW